MGGRERTPTGWPCGLSDDYWIVACIILIRVLAHRAYQVPCLIQSNLLGLAEWAIFAVGQFPESELSSASLPLPTISSGAEYNSIDIP